MVPASSEIPAYFHTLFVWVLSRWWSKYQVEGVRDSRRPGTTLAGILVGEGVYNISQV